MFDFIEFGGSIVSSEPLWVGTRLSLGEKMRYHEETLNKITPDPTRRIADKAGNESVLGFTGVVASAEWLNELATLNCDDGLLSAFDALSAHRDGTDGIISFSDTFVSMPAPFPG